MRTEWNEWGLLWGKSKYLILQVIFNICTYYVAYMWSRRFRLSGFLNSGGFPVTYLWCSLTTARTSSERWRESSENLKSSLSWALRSSTWDSSPARVFLTPYKIQKWNTSKASSSHSSSKSKGVISTPNTRVAHSLSHCLYCLMPCTRHVIQTRYKSAS